MSNSVIDTNILGNKVTGMKTKSNMAKILDNLHISRNFRKSGHHYENYVKYVKLCNKYKYFRKLGHWYEN